MFHGYVHPWNGESAALRLLALPSAEQLKLNASSFQISYSCILWVNYVRLNSSYPVFFYYVSCIKHDYVVWLPTFYYICYLIYYVCYLFSIIIYNYVLCFITMSLPQSHRLICRSSSGPKLWMYSWRAVVRDPLDLGLVGTWWSNR